MPREPLKPLGDVFTCGPGLCSYVSLRDALVANQGVVGVSTQMLSALTSSRLVWIIGYSWGWGYIIVKKRCRNCLRHL
jgi:hypothetical protein